jgi:CRP-like cAMP-binding protein
MKWWSPLGPGDKVINIQANLLLASLRPDDINLLTPLLKPVHLEQKTVLFHQGEHVPAVYFPAGAAISLVAGLSTGHAIEAAMIGKDGVVGASCALDSNVSVTRGIVQLGGDCFICEPHKLKALALQRVSLHSKLIRHDQVIFAQAQQSAACIAVHTAESRLARWLLRARALCGSDTLPFTQEYLSEMLAVRRTTVTTEAQKLQQAGLIDYHRGKIQITNAEGLHAMACECYDAVNAQYEVLLRTM